MYRGSPPCYTEKSQVIGGKVHSGDLWIDRELAQSLVALHDRLPDAVFYGPLGIGRHVDHQIVSSAIDRLIQRRANVKLYEDFPYVLQAGAPPERKQEIGGRLGPAFVEKCQKVSPRQEGAGM